MWQRIFTHTASEQVAGRKLWKDKRNSTERGNLPTPNSVKKYSIYADCLTGFLRDGKWLEKEPAVASKFL
jgi:hypothetical protein